MVRLVLICFLLSVPGALHADITQPGVGKPVPAEPPLEPVVCEIRKENVYYSVYLLTGTVGEVIGSEKIINYAELTALKTALAVTEKLLAQGVCKAVKVKS